MKGYAAKDVARLLGLSPIQVRAFARSGFLQPDRGPRGEFRFSFPDLVLLRAAKGLAEARIPLRRITHALRKLRQQLPSGRPLSAVRITAEGDRIVVHDGATAWNPESGQLQLDFHVADLASRAPKRSWAPTSGMTSDSTSKRWMSPRRGTRTGARWSWTRTTPTRT